MLDFYNWTLKIKTKHYTDGINGLKQRHFSKPQPPLPSSAIAHLHGCVDIRKCAKALYQKCIDDNPENRYSLPLDSVFIE